MHSCQCLDAKYIRSHYTHTHTLLPAILLTLFYYYYYHSFTLVTVLKLLPSNSFTTIVLLLLLTTTTTTAIVIIIINNRISPVASELHTKWVWKFIEMWLQYIEMDFVVTWLWGESASPKFSPCSQLALCFSFLWSSFHLWIQFPFTV